MTDTELAAIRSLMHPDTHYLPSEMFDTARALLAEIDRLRLGDVSLTSLASSTKCCALFTEIDRLRELHLKARCEINRWLV